MFETLGVGHLDIAVYRVLIDDPDATTETIATRVAANVEAIARSLAMLEERGFVRRSHAVADKYRAEPPQLAFERLLGDHERELHRAQEELSGWRTKAAELIEDLNRTNPRATTFGEFERLVGLDEIVGRMRDLARSANVSVDSIVPVMPSKHGLDQARVDDGELLDRGVSVRAIYRTSARQDPDAVEFARWFRRHGGLVRTALDVPNRVVIYDREVALFRSDPRAPRQGAIVLNTPGAVMALHSYFDLLWATGEELGAEDSDDDALKPDERDLLRLMARGDKDESIARTLGISIRTVRRLTNSLSARAEASSRFELGVQAVKRGWLD
ncbi:helix-turn-helix domain-containing protein [Georgenia alba]|uniref:Helix-turn-helix domain-containing protein n=1 Tax=Georgenia alba TaxID=2233858 RepID=A0ABW2Q6H5_9MICO